jgi:hypothetical protein
MYYGSDLNEVYTVYSVCKSNNTDGAMGKIQSWQVSYLHTSSRNDDDDNTKNNNEGGIWVKLDNKN